MAATPLNARQRYALYQARDYGNFGAVTKTTANSLLRRGLVVTMNPHRTSWHVQLTPAGWALLTDREQVVTINRAYEAAVTEEATRRANVCEWCGNAVRQDPVVGLCHVSVAYDHDHKAR